MANRTFILFETASGWRYSVWPTSTDQLFTELPGSAGRKPSEIASDISVTIQAGGYDGKAVSICVSSAWCLSASISLVGISRGDSREMLYRLEESLPLAAESVVADFVVAGDSALGVCARVDEIRPIVTELEAIGIRVQSIIPTALATAQQFARSEPNAVLLFHEPGFPDSQLINLVVMRDGIPTHWALLPATADDLKRQMDLLSAEGAPLPPIHGIGIASALVAPLLESESRFENLQGTEASALAANLAADVLRGGVHPWVEFRRHQLAIEDPVRLHRKWINRALAAAIVLAVSITFVFTWRSHRYQLADRANTSEMVNVFVEQFPGWEIPSNVPAIVDAQYRRARGGAAAASLPNATASALITMHDVLSAMASQDQLQISRMAFHENAFEITGRVQSYEQLDAIAKLAGATGMTVAPAQTRKDTDGSWTFVLQGSRSPEKPST